MNIVFFGGNAGGDAEIKTIQSGDKVCSFSVAVKQGFGRDASTEWYRVSVWGNRGVTLAPLIKRGNKVTVCGDLTIGEYNGKPQYNVRAHDVDPFCNGKDSGTQDRAPASQNRAPAMADLDDDVPF